MSQLFASGGQSPPSFPPLFRCRSRHCRRTESCTTNTGVMCTEPLHGSLCPLQAPDPRVPLSSAFLVRGEAGVSQKLLPWEGPRTSGYHDIARESSRTILTRALGSCLLLPLEVQQGSLSPRSCSPSGPSAYVSLSRLTTGLFDGHITDSTLQTGGQSPCSQAEALFFTPAVC